MNHSLRDRLINTEIIYHTATLNCGTTPYLQKVSVIQKRFADFQSYIIRGVIQQLRRPNFTQFHTTKYSSNEIRKTENEHLIIVCQNLISL